MLCGYQDNHKISLAFVVLIYGDCGRTGTCCSVTETRKALVSLWAEKDTFTDELNMYHCTLYRLFDCLPYLVVKTEESFLVTGFQRIGQIIICRHIVCKRPFHKYDLELYLVPPHAPPYYS